MTLLPVTAPIAVAPMAGGPSTPELAAAVSAAGGLGMLAAGYLTADAMAAQITATQQLLSAVDSDTALPFGINLFVPETESDPRDPADHEAWEVYRNLLHRDFPDVGLPYEPRWSDDDWQAKLRLLTTDLHVPFVSFTFGLPRLDVVKQLQERGTAVGVTVTNVADAQAALELGVDVLIAQGIEAGGHQSTFTTAEPAPTHSIRELLDKLRPVLSNAAKPDTEVTVIAAGGVAGPHDVDELIAAGADIVQVGTLFLTTDEAGTKPVHKAALLSGEFEDTVLTRAFSGRLARSLVNQFTKEFTAVAPAVYPQVHYLTSPIRTAPAENNSPEALNLWAGTGFVNCQELPAGVLVRWLASKAH
ncbi:nitronate monooxygenase [Corynebacterium sp. H78]|uniref:nitronate monooxygenase n=1 Tax=Corynebacterium sp. H78 TaxID=3133417 RepID=UPI0030B11CDC